MRITHEGRTYEVLPDDYCWKLSTIRRVEKTSSPRFGEEYEADTIYPGRFDQALQALMDRILRDTSEQPKTLTEATTLVAALFASIGDAARKTKFPLGVQE